MIKSVINSDTVKKIVHEVVDSTLDACACQQEANDEPYMGYHTGEDGIPIEIGMCEPSSEMKEFARAKPTKVKMTFEFYFGEETHSAKHAKLFCMPVINLSDSK